MKKFYASAPVETVLCKFHLILAQQIHLSPIFPKVLLTFNFCAKYFKCQGFNVIVGFGRFKDIGCNGGIKFCAIIRQPIKTQHIVVRYELMSDKPHIFLIKNLSYQIRFNLVKIYIKIQFS